MSKIKFISFFAIALFIISGAAASADVLTVTVTKGTLKAFNFTVPAKAAKAEPVGIGAAANVGDDSIMVNGFDVSGVEVGQTREIMKVEGSIDLKGITVNSITEGCEVTFGTK